MTKFNSRNFFKKILPTPIRRVIRGMLSYYNRLSIWPIILWQVNGVAWADKWTLLRSAVASPYFAFFRLMEWQDPILLADADVYVANVGKFHLRKKSDDLYHVTPWREKAVFEKIREILKPGDVYIDAGANIGFFTVLASRLVGDDGRVICIEMIPDTADQLENNVRINHLENVTIIRNALSDISDQTIIAMVEPGRFGRASVSVVRQNAVQIHVISTTLDEICSGIKFVRLMKMDIEGSEFTALQGAKKMIGRLDNVIYEKWGCVGGSLDLVGEFLINNSFTLSQIDESNYLANKA